MSRRRGVLRSIRWTFALVALGLVGAVWWFSEFGFDDVDGLSIDGVELGDLSEGMRLTRPRFTGATAAGEPFSFRAETAIPDGPRPEVVTLDTVSGEIALKEGDVITVAAPAGLLRPRDRRVSLTGGVTADRSDGYAATADSAQLDVRAGVLTAKGDVLVTGPLGRVQAGEMRVERREEGDYIVFSDRVRVAIDKPNMSQRP